MPLSDNKRDWAAVAGIHYVDSSHGSGYFTNFEEVVIEKDVAMSVVAGFSLF